MIGRIKTIVAISAASLILAGCGQRTPGTGGSATGKPPKAGATQKVHLVWQAGAWKVSLNGGPPVDPSAAKTSLAYGIGPTKFEVDIQGPPSAPTFKDPGGLDAWEGANAKSNHQDGINSTQILGPAFTKDGKKMIFWDLNQGALVTVNYQINLSDGSKVDPIVDNGGGNWQ